MTKMEFPNKPGNVRVDDIEIYIFPDKIIVDTGNRQTAKGPDNRYRDAHAQKKRTAARDEPKKPKKDLVNSILDSCEDVVMGRTKVR
jgi:hypothetical protein